MKKIFKKLINYAIVSVLMLFLVAFTQTTKLLTAGLQVQQATTTGGTVVWANAHHPISFDPIRIGDLTSTSVLSQVLQGLTVINPKVDYVDLQGALATHWVHYDPYTWYFYLREGVYFHDGRYFDADVAVLNIERVLDPAESVPQAHIIDMISRAEAVDTYTLRVTTHTPFAPLAYTFAHRVLFMVSPTYLENDRGLQYRIARHPIGTGPFVFHSYEAYHNTIFARNENYWGQLASPDYLRIWTVAYYATRFSALEAGDAHFIMGMPSDYYVAQNIPHLDTHLLTYSPQIEYIGFNVARPILSDLRVRQGIAHAIDRQSIINNLAMGMGTIAHGPASPAMAHAPQGQSLEYNPQRASELLTEAGITPQNRVTLNFFYNYGNYFRGAVGYFLQTELAQYGIDLVVTSLKWGDFLDAIDADERDMFILSWSMSGGDADGIYPLFHSSLIGGRGNRTFWYHPEVDEMLDEARASSDGEKRDYLYERITEIINYYQPKVFLRFTPQAWITNGIDNLYLDFFTIPHFRDVTFR